MDLSFGNLLPSFRVSMSNMYKLPFIGCGLYIDG